MHIYRRSEYEIVKMCDQFQVPRPPSGYWAQLKWGTDSPRPELPAIDSDDLVELERFRTNFAGAKLLAQAKSLVQDSSLDSTNSQFDEDAIVQTKKDEVNRLEIVPEQLPKALHPIVRKLKAKPDEQQRKATQHSDWQYQTKKLTVSVSKNQRDRAPRILDSIYKTWESLGFTTRLSDGALVDGEHAVVISLTEL